MVLMRLLVFEGLRQNVRITAHYVNTKLNGRADALSRLDLACFYRISGEVDKVATDPPETIWPVSKIWFSWIQFFLSKKTSQRQ